MRTRQANLLVALLLIAVCAGFTMAIVGLVRSLEQIRDTHSPSWPPESPPIGAAVLGDTGENGTIARFSSQTRSCSTYGAELELAGWVSRVGGQSAQPGRILSDACRRPSWS